jgi:antirestriction protein ArdC
MAKKTSRSRNVSRLARTLPASILGKTEETNRGEDRAIYSREELVAEMGAAFLAGYCRIENRTINNSAAYVANWLGVLKNDSRMVLVAASQAQKAADLILGVIPR